MSFQTFTVKQVAGRLQFCQAKIRTMIRGGEIKASKIGSEYRISERELYKLMDDNEVKILGRKVFN